MSKDVSFKNHDRFVQIGITISTIRKMRGMSQEQLAEKVRVSRSYISAIAPPPGIAQGFSLEVFFNIADALEVEPSELITISNMLYK